MKIVLAHSVALAALCLVTRQAPAAVWYVAKYSPGPAHDGKTWQTAMTTIPQAITAAAPGDEVWVGYGTYYEPITIKPNVSLYGGFVGYEFFRDQRIGLQGITTLAGTGPVQQPTISAIGANITELTVIDGFTFTGTSTTSSAGAAINCNFASPTISHNAFVGMFTGKVPVIACFNAKAVIRDNFISACNGTAAPPQPVIYLNGATGAIVNNTIVGNGGYAVGGTSSALIANNIVAYNVGIFSVAAYGKLPTYRNNCIYGNLLVSQLAQTDPSGANGNFSADPKFAVYAYGNLHLAADSPCRDAGDDSAIAAGETDIDFQPRVQGAHVDIGADESDGRTWTFSPRIVRVSPTGNDANDGSTWALAKKTIQAGINGASAGGGDVWVQTGSYALSQGTRNAMSLPPFCYIYGGFAGTETSLDQRDWIANPTVVSDPLGPIFNATGGYRVSAVDGFVMAGSAALGSMAAGITCNGSSPYVRNNVCMRNAGAVVSTNCGRPYIFNNAFFNNTLGSQPFVVGGMSSNVTVIGNVFSGNNIEPTAQNGVVYGDKLSTCVVKDNLFEDGLAGAEATRTLTGGVQCAGTIANNTFVNNRGIAINSLGGTVANNTVAFNDTGIFAYSSSIVAANCVYGNTSDYGETNHAGKDGNISAYPGFKSLVQGDYRLLDSSPCVDAGRDSFVSPGDLDLDGLPRVQGRGVDIGCYESAASSMIAHWNDIARALRIAGGLAPASADDFALIGSQQAPASSIDLLDAQKLIRLLSAVTK